MNRKKLKLNMRFNNGKVICAKSPSECKKCNIKDCEPMDLFYYSYSKKDLRECFNNSEKKT